MAVVAQSHRPPPPVPAGPAAPLRKISFRALGTMCEVQYAGGEAQASAFERAAVAWVNAFEAKYSRFRADSLISHINDAAGKTWIEIDAEMEAMLKLCDTLHFMTQGVLDPTALPLLRLWNYKAEHPRAAEIAAARALAVLASPACLAAMMALSSAAEAAVAACTLHTSSVVSRELRLAKLVSSRRRLITETMNFRGGVGAHRAAGH